jgi:hypothetical protein
LPIIIYICLTPNNYKMKKIFLITSIMLLNTVFSQKAREKLHEFTLEYDTMRYSDLANLKDNWKAINTIVSFNKTGDGKVNIKSDNGFELELTQISQVEKLVNENAENREYLLSLLEDNEGNQYELELYLDEKADLLLYIVTDNGITHGYQFLKRKFYEKTDNP